MKILWRKLSRAWWIIGYRFKMMPDPSQSVEFQGNFECIYLKYRRCRGMNTSPRWVPVYLPSWPAQIPCTHQPHRMPRALRAPSFHSTAPSAKTSCPSWLPGNCLLTTQSLTPMSPSFDEIASCSFFWSRLLALTLHVTTWQWTPRCTWTAHPLLRLTLRKLWTDGEEM